MAIGIPEHGGNDSLNDAERLILQQEPQIVAEHAALQTAQAIEAFSEITPDLIRESLPQMSEKQRGKVLRALRLAIHQIAKHSTTIEIELAAPDTENESVAAPPIGPRPPLMLIGVTHEQLATDEDHVIEQTVGADGEQGDLVPAEKILPRDTSSIEEERLAVDESSSEGTNEVADTQDVEPESEVDNDKKTPIHFDQVRLERYGKRIFTLWGDNSTYPLSTPITSDEAIGLLNELYFTPVNFQAAKKDPNRQERLVARLTSLLEGKPYEQVATEEREQYNLKATGKTVGAYLTGAGPLNAIRFLQALQSGELLAEKEKHAETISRQASLSAPTALEEAADRQLESSDQSIAVKEVQASGVIDFDRQSPMTIEEPTSVEEEVVVPIVEAPEDAEAGVPVVDEPEKELSELELLIQKQLTDYDPEIAELIIDAMQNDGQPRHKKGLDAKDIAQAHGIHDSVPRRVYSKLLRDGKLKGFPAPVTRTREGGQQSAHYLPRILYVLLPAVAIEAEKEHQKPADIQNI